MARESSQKTDKNGIKTVNDIATSAYGPEEATEGKKGGKGISSAKETSAGRASPRRNVENQVKGPKDAVASEVIKQLPWEKFYIIKKAFPNETRREGGGTKSWKSVKLVFFAEPEAEPRKEKNKYKAIALASVMSKWYASCVFCAQKSQRVGSIYSWEALLASVVSTFI